MKRFRVFEPPEAEEPSERAVFLRDGVTLFALVLPWLWLLWNRLFLAGLLCIALLVAIRWQFGLSPAALALQLLVSALVALEGPSLRARKWRRKGWRETAAFWAENRAEAELRYDAAQVNAFQSIRRCQNTRANVQFSTSSAPWTRNA